MRLLRRLGVAPTCARRTTRARSPWPTRSRTASSSTGCARLDPDMPIVSEEVGWPRVRGPSRLVAVLAGGPARRHQGVHQAAGRVHRERRADRGRRAGVRRGARHRRWALCTGPRRAAGAWREERADAAERIHSARPAGHAADRGGEPFAPVRRSSRNTSRPFRWRGGSRRAARSSSAGSAEGQADVYPRLGPTMEWDVAAGIACSASPGGMASVRHPSRTTRRTCATPASSSVCDRPVSSASASGRWPRPRDLVHRALRLRQEHHRRPGAPELARRGVDVEHLDGDSIREIFPNTGFSRAERDAHIRRVGYLASKLEAHGVIVVASFVSPYAESRDVRHGSCCQHFIEIHVATPLDGVRAARREGAVRPGAARRDPATSPASTTRTRPPSTRS